ncbi:MAG: hypothetical protein E6K11_05830 [Methanobacteriota archaeon]|nr:MAG: hypothetical protein E6K11_05830 [Euryarchaeota archaeon]
MRTARPRRPSPDPCSSARSGSPQRPKVRAFGDQSTAKAGAYASLRATGIVSAFPFFAAPKDRSKVYALSKGVRAIASKVPGAAFTSRLAHLWEEEANFMRRMAFLRSLKTTIDTAHVAQPLVAP